MKKIYDEQNVKVLNKGRIQPCILYDLNPGLANNGNYQEKSHSSLL